MAGYFSNHSQSRFVANSNSGGNGGNQAGTGSGTGAVAAANANPANGAVPAMRVRAQSSRHFSTSLSTGSSGDERPAGKEKHATAGGVGGVGSDALPTVHPLRNTWVFYFRQQRAPGNKTVNYEEGIRKISTFHSVESFWSLWTHLQPPSSLQPTTDYLLFHAGVRRPVWEDPVNIQGGKWIIRLRKGVADRLWERIILAVIGDQFDDCGPSPADADSWRTGTGGSSGTGRAPDGVGMGGGVNGGASCNMDLNGTSSSDNEPEICGCTLSVRQHEDILSLWNKHGVDSRVNQKIRETMRRILELPPNTVIEYKSNNDSMQDKSSFRNPQADRERGDRERHDRSTPS